MLKPLIHVVVLEIAGVKSLRLYDFGKFFDGRPVIIIVRHGLTGVSNSRSEILSRHGRQHGDRTSLPFQELLVRECLHSQSFVLVFGGE